MKKIVISENIKKEFLKCFVYGNYKIEDFDLEKVKITSSVIEFKKDKSCKILKNVQKFLEIFDNKDLKKLLLSDNIYNLIYLKKYSHINFNKKTILDAYNALRKKWGYKIVELSKISVCPYCNRNFIFNFDKDKTNIELDHFFPKEQYPYLALNLYNLVPSCHTCNHKKGNSKKLHLHPFFEDIDEEIKFSLNLKNTQFYHSINGFKVDIKYKSEKAQNHIEVFNLRALYDEHKDIILELIQKKYMYDDSYLDELTKKYEGTLFKNREDLMRLISGGYISEDEINKRPLSKLIKDISEDLDLI